MCTRDDAEVAHQDNQPDADGQAPKALKPADLPREDPHPVDGFAQPPQDGLQHSRSPYDYPTDPQQPAHQPNPAADAEKLPEPQVAPAVVQPPVVEPPASIQQSVASDWQNVADLPALLPAVKETHDRSEALKKDTFLQEKLRKHLEHYLTTQGDIQKLKHINDGHYFEGETWRDLPHGFGKMIMKDGTLYEGFFTSGQPDRFVRVIRPNREVYIGEFSNQRPNGEGKRIDSNGATTTCDQWNNGVENGKTTKTDKNGKEVFKGTKKDGLMVGHCVFYNENEKCTYDGPFVGNILEGQGKKTWENGKSFEGTYVKGVENGKGKMTFVDGRIWEGDFLNGKPHGTGTMVTDAGVRLPQKWVEGKRV